MRINACKRGSGYKLSQLRLATLCACDAASTGQACASLASGRSYLGAKLHALKMSIAAQLSAEGLKLRMVFSFQCRHMARMSRKEAPHDHKKHGHQKHRKQSSAQHAAHHARSNGLATFGARTG